MEDFIDFVNQVKRANDIVEVVGSYLELRQSGANYFARCPFHGEKTGSFCVSRTKQFYKCYGCGESGDVIKFICKYESLPFWEALELLAKRANIPMPEKFNRSTDGEYEQKKKQKDLYLQICKDTAIFYYKSFNGEHGQIARDYATKRQLDADTLRTFGIGYSPDRYLLVKYLESKGYSHKDMVTCGVVQSYVDKRTQTETFVDALGGRWIIPIKNMQGQVIAFGGRALSQAEEQRGKYKNTSETPLFVKNQNLFGINLVKEQKQQANLPNIVIVEGYMDVISMYQAGFKRAVASMGTSLTENQARWLSRLTDTVYICYDGDGAGQKATVRGMDILDKAGLEVKVMSVPRENDVKDPDEFIKKYGADAFEKLIEKALPLPDYKLQLLDKSFPIDSPDQSVRNVALPKYVKGALSMLQQLDDVRQTHYITVVSLKTGYSQEYFRRKLAEGISDNEPLPTTYETNAMSQEDQAKYFVASAMLNNQSYAKLDEKPLCDTLFLSNIFNYLFTCKLNGQTPSPDMLYTICPDAPQSEYDKIIDVDFGKERSRQNKEYFDECVKIIVVEKLKRQRDKLIAQIKQNPDDMSLLQQLTQINQQINSAK